MEFVRAAAILPVRDVTKAVALYRQLGFEGWEYEHRLADGRSIYGFLKRDRIQLHLAFARELDPHHNTSAVYLYIDDPDALHKEWSAVAPEGTLRPPEDTSWGMREMSYSDPDGNLLRIGRLLNKTD